MLQHKAEFDYTTRESGALEIDECLAYSWDIVEFATDDEYLSMSETRVVIEFTDTVGIGHSAIANFTKSFKEREDQTHQDWLDEQHAEFSAQQGAYSYYGEPRGDGH